ncbi:TAP-like protein-domain-containing protein [Phaeosphaeria sp. MPI-PUGE-AT-0046c]|nr:TAP-like protein-domain-containing protein [Phaeosphaeria sp. MPI-PUGE-AT-0046c]
MMENILCIIAILATRAIATPVALNKATDNSIIWGRCDPVFQWFPSSVQCGNLSVPIDWDKPHGGMFNLSMVKLSRPSHATSEKLGTLFMNPGGPGSSAARYVASMNTTKGPSSEILQSYDIMGVDPRGVGLSAPIRCDSEIWNERVSLFSQTQDEYDRLVDKNKRLGQSCIERTGELMNHLDTISVAKDYEAVRAALGEAKFNYLGLSYGTQIGAQYAELFPDKVGAMVLDGVLQHSQAESMNILAEGTAYEAALESFFDWASTSPNSILKGQDVGKLWHDLLNNATARPLAAPSCDSPASNCRMNVTEDEIRLNAQQFFLPGSEHAKSWFATVLYSSSQNFSQDLASKVAHEPTNQGYIIPVIFVESQRYISVASACQDWSPRLSSFEDMQAKMRIAEVFTPLTRGASQSWAVQASCIGWPAPVTNPPTKLNVDTGADNPILMVTSTHDPSTSYTWAVGMLEEIKSGVLLTRDGEGHTSWGRNGKTTEAITRFLLTKELPDPGTVLDS